MIDYKHFIIGAMVAFTLIGCGEEVTDTTSQKTAENQIDKWVGWGSPKGYFKNNKAYVNGDGWYHSGLYNDTPLDLTQEFQISFVINQPLSENSPWEYVYAGITVSPGDHSKGANLLNYIFVDGGNANYGEKVQHGIRIGSENVGINNGKPLNCTISYQPIGNNEIEIHYKIVKDANQVIERTNTVTTTKTIGYIAFEGRGDSFIHDIQVLTDSNTMH